MSYPSEITVILKDEERTLRTKFLSHDPFQVSPNDSYIKECIDKCVVEFIKNVDHEFEIKIKINMQVQ